MSAAPLSSNESLEAVLAKVNEVAVLPHAVYKILEISGSATAAASELEKAIVVDPGFSTRLLAHANCAFYGLPKKVTSIKDATMFLGFKQIRTMAMTVGFFDLFAGKNDKESLRRRAWWRTSIDAAICARWIAQETKKTVPDEAYTVGLLHQIGKTILDRYQSGAYDEVETLIAAEMSPTGAERAVFGCDHIEVCMGACAKWGLPDLIVDSLDYERPSANPETLRNSAALAFGHACALAAIEGLHHSAPEWALEPLGIHPGESSTWVERAVDYLTTHGRPTM